MKGRSSNRGRSLPRASLSPGGTAVYDVVRKTIYRKSAGNLCHPGECRRRPRKHGRWKTTGPAEHHLSISTPVIIKYRDEKTDASTALEGALR